MFKDPVLLITFLVLALPARLYAIDFPFPPEKLIQEMKDIVIDSEVVGAIVPNGRSDEQPDSDLLNPRTLLGVTGFSRTGVFQSIFLGYIPKTKQLQVIEWNPITQKNEFYMVENYGLGLTPKVSPPQTTCFACHQNKGPIFSVDPWTEILNPNDSNSSADVEKIRTDPSAEPFVKRLLNSKDVNLDPESFDNHIGTANRLLLSKKVCENACGENINCRRALIAASLFPESLPPQTDSAECAKSRKPETPPWVVEDICGKPDRDYKAFRNSFLKKLSFDKAFGNYPDAGVGFASDSLPDRDPSRISDDKNPKLDPRVFRKMGDDLSGEHGYTVRVSIVSKNKVAQYLSANATDCYPIDRKQIVGIPRDQLAKLIESPQFESFLRANSPLRAGRIISFFKGVGFENQIQSCATCPCSGEDTTQTPLTSNLNELNDQARKAAQSILVLPKDATPIEAFKFYCSDCHGSGPKAFPLQNTSSLSRYIGPKGHNAEYMIRNHLMPEVGAPQPTPDQIDWMLDSLK